MERQPHSCTLEVLLARDAPKGVILRRGPTKWVQLILWHTDNDTFEDGQWFRGRIYGQVSDLSPDGSLFLYMALKERTPARRKSDYTYKWTAISKPPYFTALALWPLGDEWYGGGVFLNDKTVCLCQASGRAHPDHKPEGLNVSANMGLEIFRKRDLRDGWQVVQQGRFERDRQPAHDFPLGKAITIQPYIWKKYQPGQRYSLVNEIYREPNFKWEVLHYAVDETNDTKTLLDDVSWADWDQGGRLVFAKGGQLFASETVETPLEMKMIADFHANTPTSVEPPRWATQWKRK
jgi:hypothetical protein